MNPVSLIMAGMNNLEYERGFAEGKIGIAFYYGKTGNTIKANNGYRINASEQSVALHAYIKNIGKPALWFGPKLSFISSDITDNNNPGNRATGIGTLGLSMSLGVQLVLGGLYISPYFSFGGALTNDLWGEVHYYGNLTPNRLIINYGLKTGIAF